jgi:hypothetical protein
MYVCICVCTYMEYYEKLSNDVYVCVCMYVCVYVEYEEELRAVTSGSPQQSNNVSIPMSESRKMM